MKTGPNRKTLGPGGFLLDDARPDSLGKIGRTDFANHPAAELDILDVYVSYGSKLRAQQNAPSLTLLRDRLGELIRTTKLCHDRIEDFCETGEDSAAKVEFGAAIDDLLRDVDVRRSDLDDAMSGAVDILDRLGLYLAAAKEALDVRMAGGDIVEVSTRDAADDFYRRLHRVLVRHGLDTTLGENSLLVLLVMKLEAKWQLTARSGPEASEEATRDRRRRKDLAVSIKAAVKPN